MSGGELVATSVRLAEGLKGEAARYAVRVGISLNALVAIALRDYLDRPRRGGPDELGVPASGLPPHGVGNSARQVAGGGISLQPSSGGNRKQRRVAARGKRGKR